jgi:[acyl-carrier-protein] S-malonyltransferase
MSVAAWVDGEAIGAAEVHDRLVRLRTRDRAGSLPDDDTREGRQLRRWVTQVAVVERLCEHLTSGSCSEPHRIPYPGRTNETAPWPPGIPTRADAAALGSIVAAAWANPAVPQAAALLTADVAVPADRLRQAAELAATDDGGTAWSREELLTSARLEVFARWLARATYDRVRLEEGYEHPGDASQPDNLHEH